MKVGVIGLGRMGIPVAQRLLSGGHQVQVHNRSPRSWPRSASGRRSCVAHRRRSRLRPRSAGEVVGDALWACVVAWGNR